MELTPYRLPDGRIVQVDASAAKDARMIGFTLADGTIVDAIQVSTSAPGYASSETAYGRIVNYGFAVKVF